MNVRARRLPPPVFGRNNPPPDASGARKPAAGFTRSRRRGPSLPERPAEPREIHAQNPRMQQRQHEIQVAENRRFRKRVERIEAKAGAPVDDAAVNTGGNGARQEAQH